jgi:hypothetical protein
METRPGIFKRLWRYYKPPMSLKEAKQKGWRYLAFIVLFYLIRDTILYIIIPLFAYKAIAD